MTDTRGGDRGTGRGGEDASAALPASAPLRFRAILFDLDGTLCDTHGLIMQCYDHTMRQHLDQPMRREIWERLVGLPLDDIFRATYAHYDRPLSPELMDTLKHTYRAHMREHADTVRAFHGVVEMLDSLRAQNVRLAIVTTKHRQMAERHLQTSGLTDYFEFVVAGDDVTKVKPDAEPFLNALHRLGLPADQVAHVGDSPHDITGAKAAGLYAIAALWGADNRAALSATHPDSSIDTPAQLAAPL